jgi:hypothetical protein
MEKRRLRALSSEQQSEANLFYKLMAVAIARHTEDGVVLARNQYVEATIWELLETVPDKFLLLTAWISWFKSRERIRTLKQIQWPVTQFQRELDGALAAAEESCFGVEDYIKKHGLHSVPDREPEGIAYRLLHGGAR